LRFYECTLLCVQSIVLSNCGKWLNVVYKSTHVSRLQTAQNVQFSYHLTSAFVVLPTQPQKGGGGCGKRTPHKENKVLCS